MSNKSKFIIRMDRALQPDELQKRLYRPVQTLLTRKVQSKKKWLKPVSSRVLVKRILNRFPFLWRPARWVYNHLYINRHFYHLNARLDRLEIGLQQLKQYFEQLESKHNVMLTQQAAVFERQERNELLLSKLEKQISLQREELHKDIQENHKQVSLRLEELAQNSAAELNVLKQRMDELNEIKETLHHSIRKMEISLKRVETRQSEHELVLKAAPLKPQAGHQAQPLTLKDTSRLDRFYLEFENRFRGEESAIGAYQQHYKQFIPEVAKEKPILDIGCGRGEWLEFLREQGFKIEGVDLTCSMVERCQQKDLPVRCADGFSVLEKAEVGTYAAITAFHVVEHLPFPKILEFMEKAWQALDDQGVMILETPNPENLQVGAHTFWMDPTHIKPLPPALLAFAAEYVGFARTHIERLHPYRIDPAADPHVREIQSYLFREQDYALIAWKYAP